VLPCRMGWDGMGCRALVAAHHISNCMCNVLRRHVSRDEDEISSLLSALSTQLTIADDPADALDIPDLSTRLMPHQVRIGIGRIGCMRLVWDDSRHQHQLGIIGVRPCRSRPSSGWLRARTATRRPAGGYWRCGLSTCCVVARVLSAVRADGVTLRWLAVVWLCDCLPPPAARTTWGWARPYPPSLCSSPRCALPRYACGAWRGGQALAPHAAPNGHAGKWRTALADPPCGANVAYLPMAKRCVCRNGPAANDR
jgi:hypothetical protein